VDEADDNSSAFGKLLLQHRRAAGLTQQDLAEVSGVSVRALRDLERGRAQAAQRRSAEALADALQLTSGDREVFLTVAREGRRRTSRSVEATALCALPPAVPDLLGREAELARLRAEAVTGGAVVVLVGHPGVGKTALAVSAAHQLRAEFPDGCFAVDLRGMDDQPLTARAALDRLLRALDVPPPETPMSETEQSNLFRTLLDGRRVLVLLDNAADEEQVRPLLATAPGCLTLVTCRRTLAGLQGARWVWLDPLPDHDAVDLLAAIVGRDRVEAEAGVAAELVALCGNLPLALRIAGNRLATRPQWSLAYLAALLRNERTRLSSLSAGDLQVRPAFEMSYRRLSPPARMVFRRLASLPGADFDVRLAGVAAESDVHVQLDELVDANLLQDTPAPGRFQLHDLIRIFAGEVLAVEEKPDQRERLSHAVLNHLLSTATAAGQVFYPDAVGVGGFSSRDEAAEWLDIEQSNWIAAQREAARLGRHRDVLDLAKAMHWYSDGRWMQAHWAAVFELGVEAAHALGSREEEAKLLNFLGWAQVFCLGDIETGYATYQQALAIAVEVDDRLEQAWGHAYLGSALERLGQPEQALEYTRQACELSKEFGFWSMQISLRNRLGRVLQALDRYDEALSVHRATIADAEEHRDEAAPETRRWMTSVVLLEVGHCLSSMGEWRQAAETFREARLAFAKGNLPSLEADATFDEGTAWLEAGEYTQARERLQQALPAFDGPAAHSRRQRVLAALERLPQD
jgi:tetratricopeptide (TPR) repeat protein/transcriptional regulator with XRE-family HTH domain